MTPTSWHGRTAVITGAASGFGLETSRLAARLGMNVVMADVLEEPLAAAVREVGALGVQVLPVKCDVRHAAEVEARGAATLARFGAPHLVFNNAGVGSGGLIWENTVRDWEWVLGVNVWGVIHGLRSFVPRMLAGAKADPAYRGHVVNTASMAGLLNAPNMGVYNPSKHAVVSISETLYQDLALVSEQVHAHVLCPYFVPTGIHQSERNRPSALHDAAPPTRSQAIAQAMSDQAVTKGKVSAAQVAQFVFDAMDEKRFYVFSHPKSLAGVQTRMEDILTLRNPTDPFVARPEIGQQLRQALKSIG
jgi:NAD(P)-dependent dehydrogenase (short-subunit alcohol dehydrogenase family)